MGQHVRIACVLGALSLAACGRKPPPPEPLTTAPVREKPAGLPAASPAAYERDGSIKGSDQRVAWLELPAAFKRSAVLSHGAHEVYEAAGLPFDKMCDFLSRRMFTGKVDMGTTRAIYHGVMPLDMNASAPRLNVTLTQTAGRMILDVERLPTADVKAITEEEARKLLADDVARAE